MSKNNMPLRISPADFFTIINGISGLFSIFFSISNLYNIAFILFLLSVLADGLDGIISKKFGSYVGQYMDEFSDIVSFCISPCVFAFMIYEIKTSNALFLLLSSIFLIFGILHLIFYHIGDKSYFRGLTTPASATIIFCISYLNFPLIFLYVALFLLSLLMILNISYPRIEKYNSVIATLIIFLAMTCITEFIYILLFATILYISFGPIYFIRSSRSF